eukprot:3911371-Prymnesium_polylepis.2
MRQPPQALLAPVICAYDRRLALAAVDGVQDLNLWSVHQVHAQRWVLRDEPRHDGGVCAVAIPGILCLLEGVHLHSPLCDDVRRHQRRVSRDEHRLAEAHGKLGEPAAGRTDDDLPDLSRPEAVPSLEDVCWRVHEHVTARLDLL